MFSSLILKLTSICNLNCSYCYMFNLADKTHMRVSNFMPLEIALLTLERVSSYLRKNGSQKFHIILHGGEPTLWPLRHFSAFLNRVTELNNEGLELSVGIQTNCYQIDSGLLELLAEKHVTLGISLDGPQKYNDVYRVTHSGRGSYERIMGNIQSMVELGYENLIGGFLTVAQPEIDPEEFLLWINTLPKTRVDVLWPIQYNYINLPWANQDYADYARSPRYGVWFSKLFELWWQRDDPNIYIRHFYDVLKRFYGAKKHTDTIGNEEIPMFVVNTNGNIEYPDYFRAYADGGSKTDFTIIHHAIEELQHDPLFAFCLNMRNHLPQNCKPCSYKDVCGGGFLPGRMGQENPIPHHQSVLCTDQFYFFAKVHQTLRAYSAISPLPDNNKMSAPLRA